MRASRPEVGAFGPLFVCNEAQESSRGLSSDQQAAVGIMLNAYFASEAHPRFLRLLLALTIYLLLRLLLPLLWSSVLLRSQCLTIPRPFCSQDWHSVPAAWNRERPFAFGTVCRSHGTVRCLPRW